MVFSHSRSDVYSSILWCEMNEFQRFCWFTSLVGLVLFPWVGELIVSSPFYEIRNPFLKSPWVGLNFALWLDELVLLQLFLLHLLPCLLFQYAPWKHLVLLNSGFMDLIRPHSFPSFQLPPQLNLFLAEAEEPLFSNSLWISILIWLLIM